MMWERSEQDAILFFCVRRIAAEKQGAVCTAGWMLLLFCFTDHCLCVHDAGTHDFGCFARGRRFPQTGYDDFCSRGDWLCGIYHLRCGIVFLPKIPRNRCFFGFGGYPVPTPERNEQGTAAALRWFLCCWDPFGRTLGMVCVAIVPMFPGRFPGDGLDIRSRCLRYILWVHPLCGNNAVCAGQPVNQPDQHYGCGSGIAYLGTHSGCKTMVWSSWHRFGGGRGRSRVPDTRLLHQGSPSVCALGCGCSVLFSGPGGDVYDPAAYGGERVAQTP